MSLDIKFPEEFYIGMITTRQSGGGKDDLPLAFITPNGTDSAAVKRKATVDGWVSQNSGRTGQTVSSSVIKNEALGGFRLLDSIRHYSSFGSGSTKWRVEDPRGFELEISSPNLMQIMENTVVDQGEILDACIWSRNGKENYLVPVSSELYKQAVVNTERSQKSASLRDLKPGDSVIMQNGQTGIYQGKFYTWSLSNEYNNSESTVDFSSKKKWVFLDGKTISVITSPKLAEITKGAEVLDEDAALKFLNDACQDGSYSRIGAYEKGFAKTQNCTLNRIKVSVPYVAGQHTGVVLYQDDYWVHYSSYGRNNPLIAKMDKDSWENYSRIRKLERNQARSSWYTKSYSDYITMEIDIAELAKCPRFERHRQIIFPDGYVFTVPN